MRLWCDQRIAPDTMGTMQDLVVKLTSSLDERERISQAISVSTIALSAGAKTSVWLSGDSAWLAVPGRAEEIALDFAPSIADGRDLILARGTLTVCSQCAARRDLTGKDFLKGVRVAGGAVFVEESPAPQTQALVY